MVSCIYRTICESVYYYCRSYPSLPSPPPRTATRLLTGGALIPFFLAELGAPKIGRRHSSRCFHHSAVTGLTIRSVSLGEGAGLSIILICHSQLTFLITILFNYRKYFWRKRSRIIINTWRGHMEAHGTTASFMTGGCSIKSTRASHILKSF